MNFHKLLKWSEKWPLERFTLLVLQDTDRGTIIKSIFVESKFDEIH